MIAARVSTEAVADRVAGSMRAAGWDCDWSPNIRETYPEYWDLHGPPPSQEDGYRPDWTPEEMTRYQIYETVSDGTPVSPVFASLDALAEWLTGPRGVEDKFGMRGRTREQAEAFARAGWAPTAIGCASMRPVDGITGLAVLESSQE